MSSLTNITHYGDTHGSKAASSKSQLYPRRHYLRSSQSQSPSFFGLVVVLVPLGVIGLIAAGYGGKLDTQKLDGHHATLIRRFNSLRKAGPSISYYPSSSQRGLG